MKIKRIVNLPEIGSPLELEFELTDEELLTAYHEKQHHYDVEVVKDKLQYYEENPDEFYEAYGTSYFILSDKIDAIAYEMRRNIDKYDADPYYALIDAIETAVRQYND